MQAVQLEGFMSGRDSKILERFFSPERGEMKDVLIRAGAGAGKTTEMVRRVISLALVKRKSKGDWPSLIVTTFTRKATQELRERLLKAGLEIGDPDLLQYLQSSQRLHISTIHGVLVLYLRHYGRLKFLAPDFRVCDAQAEVRLRKRVLKNLMRTDVEFQKQYMNLLDEYSMNELLELSIQLENSLVENPQAKRWDINDQRNENQTRYQEIKSELLELAGRLEGLKLTPGWQQWLDCFSWAAKPLELSQLVSVFLERAPTQMRAAASIGEDLFERAKAVRELIKKCQTPLQTEPGLERYEEISANFFEVGTKWSSMVQKEKLSQGELTMEDLEMYSLRLLDEHPATAAGFAKEWDYWLVDEYQDTSPRQVKLIGALTQDTKKFIVGDPQQSIYLFRGARAEVFQEALDQNLASGGEFVELMTNYRTSKPVLEFLNDVFVAASPELKPMNAGKTDLLPGQTPIHLVPIPFQEGKAHERRLLQYQAIASRIAFWMRQKVSAERICVLMQTRKDLYGFSKFAQQYNIPCQVHASGQFFEREEVIEALRFLRFLVTPDHNLNLCEILRSPWLKLQDAEILGLTEQTRYRSVWQSLKDQSKNTEIAKVYEFLNTALETSRRFGVLTAWESLIKSSGLIKSATALDTSGRREANLFKLIQMARIEERKPGFRVADFLALTEEINLEGPGDTDASPVAEPARVQLMTIHASKGLEFDHLILPFIEDLSVSKESTLFSMNGEKNRWSLGLRDDETQKRFYPSVAEECFDLMKDRSKAEMDRLMYVAMTRAQKTIDLVWQNAKDPQKDNRWVHVLTNFSNQSSQAIQASQTEFKHPICVHDLIELQALEVGGALDQTSIPPLSMDCWEQGPRRKIWTVSQVVEELAMDRDEKADQSSGNPVSKSDQVEWAKLEAGLKGVELHRYFEDLKYAREQSVQIPLSLESFVSSPGFADIKRVMSSGQAEWGFTVKAGQGLLQGQVDLWGYDDSGALVVVDYKTGSARYEDKAFSQLSIYAWALGVLGKNKRGEPAELWVVYPLLGKIIKKKSRSQGEIQREILKALD